MGIGAARVFITNVLPSILQNRWQVQIADECLRDSMCLGWFKEKYPPIEKKNENIKPPTYLDTTRQKWCPQSPKCFLSWLSYHLNAFGGWCSFLSWFEVNECRKENTVEIVFAILHTQFYAILPPGVVLDGGYELN